MDGKNGIHSRLFQCISNFASSLDDKLRIGDFEMNRTAGGLLDRAFSICRHSYEYLALPSLVVGIIIMGFPESGTRLYLAVPVFIAVLIIFILLARLSIRHRLCVSTELLLQVTIVFGIAGIVWMADGDIYQKGGGIYRHFFVLAAFVVCATLVATGFFTGWVWSRLQIQKNYDDALARTDAQAVLDDARDDKGWSRGARELGFIQK
jgi:uncharacterized membrane protein